MTDTHHQTEHERVLADIERIRQAIVELIVQTEKLRSEPQKPNGKCSGTRSLPLGA